MNKSSGLLVSSMLTLANPAQAAEAGSWSVEAGMGKLNASIDYDDLLAGMAVGCRHGLSACKINDRKTYSYTGVSYNVNRALRVAFRYEDFGDLIKFDRKSTSGGIDGIQQEKSIYTRQNTKAVSFNIQARFANKSRFTPYAELGFGYYKNQVTSTTTHSSSYSNKKTTRTHKTQENKKSLIYGLGFEIEAKKNLSVQAGWRRYHSIGQHDTLFTNSDGGIQSLDTGVNSFYLGVVYSFH